MPATSNKRLRAGDQRRTAGNQNSRFGSSDPRQPDGDRAPKLLDWNDTFQIVVGDDEIKATFHVPKQKLEEALYFKAAMQTTWLKLDVVELKDDDPEIFNFFFNWLITGEIPRITDDTKALSVQYQWLELYIFADKFYCAGLCDDIVTAFCQSPSALIAPDTEDFVSIAQSLPEGCHLLRLLCTAWVHAGLLMNNAIAQHSLEEELESRVRHGPIWAWIMRSVVPAGRKSWSIFTRHPCTQR